MVYAKLNDNGKKGNLDASNEGVQVQNLNLVETLYLDCKFLLQVAKMPFCGAAICGQEQRRVNLGTNAKTAKYKPQKGESVTFSGSHI